MRYVPILLFIFAMPPTLHAQAKGKIAKESFEFAARRVTGKTAPKLGTLPLKKAAIRSVVATTGDDAAVIIKHSSLAKPLVKQYGATATQAFSHLTSRNARRLAMLADDGPTPNKELLSVIARYGDPAMNFIWRNKAALLTASALAAFLANPEPFIDGVQHLSTDVAEHALAPVADGIASRTNWTLILPVFLGLYLGHRLIKCRFR